MVGCVRHVASVVCSTLELFSIESKFHGWHAGARRLCRQYVPVSSDSISGLLIPFHCPGQIDLRLSVFTSYE